MGIKQDYILKTIEQVLDVLFEKAFGKTEKEEIIQNFSNCEKSKNKLEELKNLVDDKKINLAENKLFEYLEDKNEENLKLALLFYDYLNSKTENFLEECNFSKEEIKEGIIDLSRIYGYENLISIYLM